MKKTSWFYLDYMSVKFSFVLFSQISKISYSVSIDGIGVVNGAVYMSTVQQ